MRALAVVVREVFGQHGSEMLLIQDNQVVEALAAERPDDSLAVWRPFLHTPASPNETSPTQSLN
jgi:hypothetical protein